MDCHEMEAVATYLPLRFLLVAFLVIAIIAIPLILLITWSISRNPLYHLNTRVLLVAHGMALLVHHSDRLVFHSSDLYRWIVIMPQTSACDIISSSERCFFLRIGFNCAMWFSICTTPALTLERWLATRNTSTYHADKCSWMLALGAQLLLAGGLLGLVYARQSFGGTTLYCMAASSSVPVHTLVAFCSTTVVQILSISVFRHLVKRNEGLRKSFQRDGGDLTKKYQVEETLRALKTLYQPVHFMFLFQFTYCVASFFVLFFNSYFSRPFYFFMMEANIYIPEYSIIFVYTFHRKEKRITTKKSNNLKINMKADPDVYFKNYNWN